MEKGTLRKLGMQFSGIFDATCVVINTKIW